jgi:DNA-binding transcriptional LysR family regulator
MNIEYFREFLVLAELLNFRVAAESLYITQPALSRHIKALENSLDTTLFKRTTQSVILTPAGEFFQSRISPLVNDYNDICSRIRIMKGGFINRLRLGVPYYAIVDYLGPVPEAFEHTFPDIKLQYNVGDPYEVIEDLYYDRIDICILPRYASPSIKGIEFIPIFEEPLGVLMNKQDPLAQKSAISLRELKDKYFFSIDNQFFSASWHNAVSLCKTVGFMPRGPALFNQMEALIMAIRRGDGITIVGYHMRNQESDLIAFRPLIDNGCKRIICICYKKDNNNQAIGKFVKLYSNTVFPDKEKI